MRNEFLANNPHIIRLMVTTAAAKNLCEIEFSVILRVVSFGFQDLQLNSPLNPDQRRVAVAGGGIQGCWQGGGKVAS